MVNPNLRYHFLNTLKGKAVDKVSALSITQTGIVELIKESRAAWPAAHFYAEKMAALALSAHTFAGLEAVSYPFCLCTLGSYGMQD